ncbi:DNA-processing protein DprA [Teredinibacter purpureus]|uniref:DNA-processing protein DprA n=1 Tax=Teredinibacter purpureus TaxID=2731756 RepID=UPI0005F86272|nr:DNA-processing protein DprA [Teredinibacter purpureus]
MLTAVEQKLLFQHLPGVGAASYWKLMERSPSLSSVLESPPDTFSDVFSEEARQMLRELQHTGENSDIVRLVRADLEWADRHSVQVLDTDHPQYPEMLREIKRPPPVLYVAGDVSQLSFPQVAIVGSRNPTPSGRGSAFDFSKALAANGFTITSGLALGVDAAAHQGALACQGKTIAVLGTGIDQVYPQRNKQIADQIIANGGALVSEFPLGTTAKPANFPQRNRIISGLSYGTLVVEAAVRSGSLITARYALQQNRELFAIPGSIHNPLARGCHSLIKDGAKLVESADDIVEELKGFLQLKWEQVNLDIVPDTHSIATEIVSNEQEDFVLDQLGYEPTAIDLLTERTSLPVGDVMACLLTLELKGLVANVGTGYMRIRGSSRGLVL